MNTKIDKYIKVLSYEDWFRQYGSEIEGIEVDADVDLEVHFLKHIKKFYPEQYKRY